MLGKKAHPPIIVVAARGSGGPLLAHALGGHSAVHGCDDGGLFVELLRLLDHPGRDSSLPQVDGELAERGIVQIPRALAAECLEALYRRSTSAPDPAARVIAVRELVAELVRQLAKQAGKPGIAVHAVDCGTRIAGVINLLPDAVIVHLVRDGRAVALLGARDSGTPTGLRPFAQAWRAEIEPLLDYEAANRQRVVKVAYEDLLVSPHKSFERLSSALHLTAQPESMTAAFESARSAGDDFAFRADALDAWQIIELESELQPILSLLGYRPAADLESVAQLRARAEAYEAAQEQVEALRARLRQASNASADEVGPAGADLDTVRREAALYRDAVDELRQLRFRMRDQAGLPADIATLRWKAKRYDQIRAAASPILRVRRRRAGQ